MVATRPFVQPDCVALESALADRCCVLVGEAGIGKSDAIDQLEAITKVAVRKAAAHGVALRDLRKLTGFVDLGLGTVALTGG